MSKDLTHYEHIPPHRLWAYATLQVDLALAEHTHIVECSHCLAVLRSCLRVDTFAAVLKELDEDQAA